MMKTIGLAFWLSFAAIARASAPVEAVPPPMEWPDLMDQLRPIANKLAPKLADPTDPQLRAELDRMLLGIFVHGYFYLLGSDPNQPMLMPAFGIPMNYAAPNGDTIYYQSRLDGHGVYRLSGHRGTVPIVQLTFIGPMPCLNGDTNPALALKTPVVDHGIDELHVGSDGSFSVMLGAQRPEGYSGDWWSIPPTTAFISVRQVSNDWGTEKDAQISVERVDVPVNLPRQPADDILEHIKLLVPWTFNATSLWLDHAAAILSRPVNTLKVEDYSHGGGLPGQVYYEGPFQFAPDEALILEVQPPAKCRYWSVLLTDKMFATVDWMNHQSSLNSHQVRLDSDGKFRAVISLKDPGVPNWLDPGGRTGGIIQGRWTGCETAPLPNLHKVQFKTLHESLLADALAVSAQARDESLRVRKRGFESRRWW